MAIRAPVTKIPEVRCSQCNVSFPPEVKRCMHCGERTHVPGSEPTLLVLHEGSPVDAAPPVEVEDEETEGRVRGPLRMISALVWILLALGGALYRACGGGA